MESIPTVEPTNGSDFFAWYCLRAQPKHEHIAAVHLRKYIGVEVFAPRIRFQQVRQQRKAWMTEALFPGYLFARFDLHVQWRAIQYSHAVKGILRFGNEYAEVSASILNKLRELVGSDELHLVDDQTLERGRQVVIAEGAFRGLQTVITGYLPAKERVKVLMNILGQDMEVEMPVSVVLPVQRTNPLQSRFGLLEHQSRDGE